MKRFVKIILFVHGLSILFPSCQKVAELQLTGPDYIEIEAKGGNGSFAFTTNRDWTVSTSELWIKVSPSSGPASDGPISISVSCSANDSYDDRTASITLMAEGLTRQVSVKQVANLGVIVSNNTLSLTSNAQEFDIPIQANIQYSVSCSESWIKRISTKGLRTDVLSFSIEENQTYNTREGSIILIPFEGVTPEYLIKVKQSGRVAVSAILLNSSNLTLIEGDSFTLSASVTPSNAYEKTIIWKTSNEEVVSINDSGDLHANRKGASTITASCGGKNAICQVVVNSVPQDEIWYTSTDGSIVNPYKSGAFYPSPYAQNTPLTIEKNTYNDGKGIIHFNAPIVSIGQDAFEYRDNLKTIYIPTGVKSIGYGSFYQCVNLVKVVLPNGAELGGTNFENCLRLSEVSLPADLKEIPFYCFDNCSALKKINIPESVEKIGKKAFYNSALSSITLPKGLSSIGESAFENCSSLKEITVLAVTPPVGNDRMFDNTGNAPIYVPYNSIEAYKSAAFWKNYASRIKAITE